MAKKRKNRIRGAGSRAKNLTFKLAFWAFCASGILIGIVFIPFVLFVFFALLPTLIVVGIDRTPDRVVTRCTVVANFAGLIHAVYYNISESNSLTNLRPLLLDWTNWALPFGFAAGGILVYFVSPYIISGFIRRRTKEKIDMLRVERRTLEETWGDSIVKTSEEIT